MLSANDPSSTVIPETVRNEIPVFVTYSFGESGIEFSATTLINASLAVSQEQEALEQATTSGGSQQEDVAVWILVVLLNRKLVC